VNVAKAEKIIEMR